MATSEMIRRAQADDIDGIKAALAADGLVLIENFVTGDALKRAQDTVWEVVEEDRARNIKAKNFSFDPDDRNIRIFNLIGKRQLFRDMVMDPLAITIGKHLLGDPFSISNFSGNITGPGSGKMIMHADAGYVPAPWPPYAFAMNVAWALSDFTEEVGATRVVPGSMHFGHAPTYDAMGQVTDPRAQTIPIECPAGSIFIMDGRVWHQTGANVTKDTQRIGLFAYYVRSFIKPQYDWQRAIPPDLRQEMSPELLAMLDLGMTLTEESNTERALERVE